ncbi:MAG: MFS transporter [Planctomycetes bacterium]|nr:MFS transporter [Planctomycetota bacterium]
MDETQPAAPRLSSISSQQWRSGTAAWLGWFFDGLDMHLYTLVATPFVAQLMVLGVKDPEVRAKSAYIMAAFLFGWAVGGGFFGVVGDRLGRSRALVLTILTYSCFTGLAFFVETWWQLGICRFLAALGVGGEWAVGAALLAETWPRTWRPWLAAVLQTAVNVGVMAATLANQLLADQPPRTLFLVGLLPALCTLWIRRGVPETAEWHAAKAQGLATGQRARIRDLFAPGVCRVTLVSMGVCAGGLTAHWAFMFWHIQQLRSLPEVQSWTAGEQAVLASGILLLVMVTSALGNFLLAALARRIGYRRAIIAGFLTYGAVMATCYAEPRTLGQIKPFLAAVGLCQGVFALFTMYLPALFPTLLRTTGAGFCYNIGRIAAAAGAVVSGLGILHDMRWVLFSAALLFFPAAGLAWFLPRDRVGDAEAK